MTDELNRIKVGDKVTGTYNGTPLIGVVTAMWMSANRIQWSSVKLRGTSMMISVPTVLLDVTYSSW